MEKTETGKGAKSKKALSKDYDEILYYTKSNNFNVNKITKPHDVVSLKEFKYEDSFGYFKIVPLGMYSKISVDKMRKNGEIYTSKFGKDYKKYYLTDLNETCLSNIWLDCKNLYNGENKEMLDYETQKPKSLLERIIYMFSNPNDIVADFFMGSGTTGEVALELGRKFIGCDISEKACEITKSRLEKFNA
jgi:DNA modification methylase